MAEKDRSSGFGVTSVIRTEQQSASTAEPSNLDKTLVKSPRWKENTLRRIRNVRSADSVGDADAATPVRTSLEQESASIREALEHQVQEAKAAKRQLRKQSEEIEQLRQTIAKLEAENAGLVARHEREIDARTTELLDLQEAYDQFEQQSDLLMDELDKKYERLLGEVRHQNPRSLL